MEEAKSKTEPCLVCGADWHVAEHCAEWRCDRCWRRGHRGTATADLVEFQVFLDPKWPPPPPPLAAAGGAAAALLALSATEAVARLAAGSLTPLELIEAFAAVHTAVDPAVNAVPILCLDRARAAATRLTDAAASGCGPSPPPPGFLHGLPVVVKDLEAVEGVRFVGGSPMHADRIAPASGPLTLLLERHGAIVVGKSNTPEAGAGSNT